jgi:hypothetical protein
MHSIDPSALRMPITALHVRCIDLQDWTMADKPREQISVTLPAELRAAVERAAQAEHRTVSQQIRHYVACMTEARLPVASA